MIGAAPLRLMSYSDSYFKLKKGLQRPTLYEYSETVCKGLVLGILNIDCLGGNLVSEIRAGNIKHP